MEERCHRVGALGLPEKWFGRGAERFCREGRRAGKQHTCQITKNKQEGDGGAFGTVGDLTLPPHLSIRGVHSQACVVSP